MKDIFIELSVYYLDKYLNNACKCYVIPRHTDIN